MIRVSVSGSACRPPPGAASGWCRSNAGRSERPAFDLHHPEASELGGVYADPDTLTRIMAETRSPEEHVTGEFDHDKHPRFHEERD